MTYIDSSVILRYLLDDDPLLSREAKIRLEGMDEKQIGVEVAAELVYVLSGVYQVSRKEIAETLIALFVHDSWKLYRKDVVLEAIKLYGSSSLDFVDSWLVSLHRITGTEILSFNKKVRRLVR